MAGTVILYCTVCPRDSQGIVQSVFFQAGVVAVIIHLFVADLLHGEILSRINGETAAVKSIVSLGLAVSKLVLQILHYLICQSIYEIGSGTFTFFHLSIYLLDPGVDVVCQSLIVGGLVNIALIQHIAQHFLAALGVGIRVCHRIVAGRTLGNAGDDRTF